MAVETAYQFLESRAGSNYRQLFVKGRRIRAEIIYRATVNAEPRTPEQVAQDYGVPLEAVREAVDYCNHHRELLQREREADWEDMKRRGLDRRPANAASCSEP